MGPLVLVLATALVLVGAASVTRLLRPDSALDAAVTFGVTATASIALVLELTGVPGQLERGPIAIVAAVGAVVAVVAARRVPGDGPMALLRRVRGASPGTLDAARRDLWTSGLVVLASGALLWQAVVAWTLPPFAYDALTYHLTTVATWVQQGDLARTPLSSCCAHYPLTSDLMFAWPMVLTGDDSFVNLVQLGFAVLAAVSVAGIARSLGLAPRLATAAGALFLTTPVVLTQAPTEYVDLMLAAWVLAGIHGILRFGATAEPRRLVVSGMAVGMSLGTKGTGVLWAVVLLAAIVVLVVVAGRRGRVTRPAATLAIASVLIACLALGSFWYVRNWVDQGNPLHPFRVEVAGRVVFDGPKDLGSVEAAEVPGGDTWPVATIRSWASDLDFWNQGAIDYQQRLGGLGPLWAWLGLPLAALGGVVLIRRRDTSTVALVVVAAVFALQPYKWWARFTIPLAAAGTLAIAAAVGALRHRAVRDALRAASFVLAAAGVALASAKVVPAGRAEALPAPEVAELALKGADERTLGRLFHREYEFLDEVPRGATVVVDLPAEPVRFVYPFFGPELERRVIRLRPATRLADAWVVTGRGRPVERRLVSEGRHELVWDQRDLRAWRPLP